LRERERADALRARRRRRRRRRKRREEGEERSTERADAPKWSTIAPSTSQPRIIR
jgi:hypothetical protein